MIKSGATGGAVKRFPPSAMISAIKGHASSTPNFGASMHYTAK